MELRRAILNYSSLSLTVHSNILFAFKALVRHILVVCCAVAVYFVSCRWYGDGKTATVNGFCEIGWVRGLFPKGSVHTHTSISCFAKKKSGELKEKKSADGCGESAREGGRFGGEWVAEAKTVCLVWNYIARKFNHFYIRCLNLAGFGGESLLPSLAHATREFLSLCVVGRFLKRSKYRHTQTQAARITSQRCC